MVAARILRLAPGAAALLWRESEASVHSVFDRSVNLQHANGRLLTLHGPGWLRAPFAAACDRLPLVSAGARVWLGSRGVRIDGELLLTTSAVVCDDPALSPGIAAAQPIGLSQAGQGASSSLARQAPALAAAIRTADTDALTKVARSLIGLGEGLTPSGDDCLVGALAALWRHGPGWAGRISRLRETLTSVIETSTTKIGAEFVDYALRGQFAEPLLHALATGDAGPLMACGATSGADTLFGATVALDALASRC
jgi:Protein of unknown function (DUF2877)